MRLLKKLLVIVVYLNKLWKIVLTNSIAFMVKNYVGVKIVKNSWKNWTARHFWRANDVAMKFYKVLYLYKSFQNWAQENVVPKLPKVWGIDFVENVVK